MKAWWGHVRNAFSQLFNAIAGGHEDETYSSRCGKGCYWDKSKVWCFRALLVNAAFRDRNHCWNAIEVDEGYRINDVPEWWTNQFQRLAHSQTIRHIKSWPVDRVIPEVATRRAEEAKPSSAVSANKTVDEHE